ncbi:SUMF1/EgtB/PvdO family nonheme iron enzyme [Urbifossiella limnaea]|uniref:Serine/threonine-protein kinase pkn1 n=1 Tax=Urbifossiella limnaea TaxID=2528023 RepID=A0A517XN60_9BACT|nr:SUMF1/EgtB/PvdO family nonheme iron enzyme [Urbifossiella limnaea]QDU18944.1 Serine/threonine-protein kinase pkn1 [Urbifossiella limnaea]
MPQIFISYRRNDTPYVPHLLRDRLVEHFGPGTVFMDIDTIPPGADFVEHLDFHIRSCGVLLAVIGDGWLGATFEDGPRAGARRLDDPTDFVRLEVGVALRRGIPVVPVLTGRATMPAAADLPADLQPLARRNAIEVRAGRDFPAHVDRVVQGVEAALALVPGAPAGRGPEAPLPGAGSAPAEARERQLRWASFHQLPAEVVTATGMRFVWIPPGHYRMGSPPDEPGRRDTEGPHPVTIAAGFYMATTPVTQAQWRAVMGADGSRFRGDLHPAESLSWDAAAEFCARLRRSDGRPYRLPTEAEWEYACRAGAATAYHTGEGEPALAAAGWYAGNSQGHTHPVGRLAPNAWGLFDTHGNVWEWCQDWYAGPLKGGVNPTGPAHGSSRTLRGGSWKDAARHCRAARRLSYAPGYQDETIGCRVCFGAAEATGDTGGGPAAG